MGAQAFWLTTVIEVNWWGHDKKAKRNCKKARMDEAKKTMQWNLELSKRFQITKEIPVVFIDPMYDDEDEKETAIFNEYSVELWSLINKNKPFVCDEKTCKDSTFTEGIPWLVSDGPIYSKVGGKLALKWQIWFGDCAEKGIKSYEIMFTNIQGTENSVYKMTESVVVCGA